MAKNPTNNEQKVSEAEPETFDTATEPEETSSSQQNELQEQENPENIEMTDDENNDSDATIVEEDYLKVLTKKELKKIYYIDLDLYRVSRMTTKQLGDLLKFDPTSYKGMFFYSNFSACRLLNKTIPRSKYFIVAFNQKLEELLSDENFKLPKDCFHSITDYSKKLPMSSLPVRIISVMGWSEKLYIFTDDVLETIPLLLQKMGKNSDEYKEKLEYLENSWKTEFVFMSRCIAFTEFKRILKDMEIDENLARFFLDHDNARYPGRVMEKDFPAITAVDVKGDFVMTSCQALFTIFHRLLCELNWSLAIDSKKKQLLACQFQKKFRKVTQKYLQMKDGMLVKQALVEADIKVLKQHQVFKKAKFEKRDCFENYPLDSFFKWGCFKHTAESYELQIQMFGEKQESDMIPVWMARAYLIFAIADNFYPENAFKEMRLLLRGILGRFAIGSGELKRSLEELIDKRAMENMEPADEKPENPKESEAEKTAATPEESVEPPKPKSKKSKKKKNLEGIACGNCVQANTQCGKLQKELRISQQKADQYEKKAKKAEDLERKLKETQDEMKELKRKKRTADDYRMKEQKARKTAEKFSNDNKASIEKFQKVEKDLKEARKTIQQKNEQVKSLEKKLNSKSKLEEQLKMTEEKLAKRAKEDKELKNSKNELRVENQKLKKQLEEQSHKMELDREQFTKQFNFMESQVTGTKSVNDELYTNTWNLQQTISKLESEVTVKTAELVEKSNTNSSLQLENKKLADKIKKLEIDLQKAREPKGYSHWH